MRRAWLLVRLAWRNVFRQRLRSAFSLGTIAAGALGLFLFMGFNGAIMNQYRANTIRARYGHGELAVKGYRGQAHAQPWKSWIADGPTVVETLRRLEGVRDVYPRLALGVFVVKGETSVVAQAEGIDGVAEAKFFDQLNFVEGGDFKDRADGTVMGSGLAAGLGVKVGDQVGLAARDVNGAPQTRNVTITGIFHTGIPTIDDALVRCPLAVAQALMSTDRIERVSVSLVNDDGFPAFAALAKDALPQLEAVSFDRLDEVYYQHGVDFLASQFGFIRIIILLVVFLGIFNVISMAVVERTAEIGTMRANGDSRLDVAAGHLLEAAFVGALGGLLGIAAGWALNVTALTKGIAMPPAPGLTRSFHIVIELQWRDALTVLALCMLTAMAGSVIPVWRATRLSIAEALRQG